MRHPLHVESAVKQVSKMRGLIWSEEHFDVLLAVPPHAQSDIHAADENLDGGVARGRRANMDIWMVSHITGLRPLEFCSCLDRPRACRPEHCYFRLVAPRASGKTCRSSSRPLKKRRPVGAAFGGVVLWSVVFCV